MTQYHRLIERVLPDVNMHQSMDMASGTHYTAHISTDGLYRYTLSRVWDERLPLLVYVMLNPSTADHETNDQTIRRCMHFAGREAYGGIIVVNLYAGRTKSPDILFHMADPVGPHNNRVLADVVMEAARNGGKVIIAWGQDRRAKQRRERILAAISSVIEPMCFGINQDGSPKHPCYLGNDHPIMPYARQQAS